jgi:aerobic-type carbon monoxide dehydrogenase small subunit (CoxS/CutS family)
MAHVKELHVNGVKRPLDADENRYLLYVLREDLGLTGTKYGCGEGRCGSCTVLIDGAATKSCQTRVGMVGSKPVQTIEGLANGDQLHPVQQAFLDCGAMQCGFCTSGMIMQAVELLRLHSSPDREAIIKGMNGNVCRCGTYPRIVTAIEQAAESMKGGRR